MPSRC